MMPITSTNHITPISLPSSAVIPPGASVDVPKQDGIKDRKNLASYVVTGVLVVEGGVQSDGQDGEEAYRRQLFIEPKALGVNAGTNSRIEALVSRLTEAKAKVTLPADEATQKRALIKQLAALRVSAGPDASLGELQKTPTDKQAEQQ